MTEYIYKRHMSGISFIRVHGVLSQCGIAWQFLLTHTFWELWRMGSTPFSYIITMLMGHRSFFFLFREKNYPKVRINQKVSCFFKTYFIFPQGDIFSSD